MLTSIRVGPFPFCAVEDAIDGLVLHDEGVVQTQQQVLDFLEAQIGRRRNHDRIEGTVLLAFLCPLF